MNDRDVNVKSAGGQTRISKWVWLILASVILLTAGIRIRLALIPFERDEGEYAYAGQLILQGIPPYEKAYNMKMPGIYVAYALLLSIFGQTHIGIHLGLIFINAVTIVLIFILTKELFGPLAALSAGAAFALLSVGRNVQGFTANAEHFVILPALAAILLLRRTVNSSKHFFIFISGLLLGLAFMMKQHGSAFIVFAGLYLFANEVHRRPFNWKPSITRGVLFSAGVFLPFVVTCLILWQCGVFKPFWFWTFDYARRYISILPFSGGAFNLGQAASRIIPPAICLWVLAGTGLFCLFWKSRFRRQSLFVIGFLILSFLSTCPGLYFRPHYFILFLPAIALLTGVGAVCLYEIFSRYSSMFFAKIMPTTLILGIFFVTVCQQWNYFFTSTPTDITRSIYGANPFPESLEIADFIAQNSQKTDTIAVIGSEPQIYFYSKRLSATSYVYTYPLMEPHPYASKMQEEMISQIEQTSPKFLVLEHIALAWLPREESDKKIFEWVHQYASKFYHTVGVVDLIAADQTTYHWGADAVNYAIQSEFYLLILRHNRYGDPSNILPLNTAIMPK